MPGLSAGALNCCPASRRTLAQVKDALAVYSQLATTTITCMLNVWRLKNVALNCMKSSSHSVSNEISQGTYDTGQMPVA